MYKFLNLILLVIVLHYTTLTNISHGLKEGLASCTCGVSVETLGVRIKGGSVLKAKTHPYLALITYNDETVCGGTIVGPQHVLTAAHCLTGVYSLAFFKVLLGVHDSLNLEPHVQKRDIEEAIVHEGFEISNGHILSNDIALLKIRKIEFNKYIQPVCLPFKYDVSRHKSAAVEGWGLLDFKGNSSNLPRVALLSILTKAQCQTSNLGKALSKVPNIYDMVLCAYSFKSDACQGDSGGPLFVLDKKQMTYQIGIVSFGVKCGSPGMPGLYTRLTNYLDWLDMKLDGAYCRVPS